MLFDILLLLAIFLFAIIYMFRSQILEFLKKKEVVIKDSPVLFSDSQEMIHLVSSDLDGDFITYWGSYNSNISRNDSIVFSRLLSTIETKRKKLYLFVKSDGGSGEASLQTIHLLREKYDEIVALVPLNCASAATMLALGADKIIMGPLAHLTAIDTSITHDLSPLDTDNNNVSVSQNELDRIIKLWNSQSRTQDKNPFSSLYKHIHPLVFGAVDRASSLSIKLTNEILSYHMKDKERVEKISHHLNADYPSHGYPITYREAIEIGLNVEVMDEVLNSRLLHLSSIYSEMAQRCYTDFSEYKYHSNQMYTTIETAGTQIHYKVDKEFVWRKEDQTWITTHDQSGWRIIDSTGIRNYFIR